MKEMSFAILNDNIKKLPVYLNGVGCDYKQEHVKRQNGHNHFIWIQCLKGEGEVFLRGEKHLLGKGKGILIYPYEPHEYYSIDEEDWYVDWIDFDGEGVKSILNSFDNFETSIYFLKNTEKISSKIRNSLTLLKSFRSDRNIECSSILYSILIDILKYSSKEYKEYIEGNINNNRLTSILEYIEKNYNNVILLEDMASIIGVTREYLCYLFKKELGVRPIEYLNSVRISESKEILMNNKILKISEVAKKVGFESTSYFCSIFKNKEGISPKGFKNLY